jgi:hypothetical protein
MQERYSVLRLLSKILNVFAWIVGIGTVVVFIVSTISTIRAVVAGEAYSLLATLMSLLYGVFGFIYLYATSEGILVFLAIEENTRKTCTLLEELKQSSDTE